MVGYVTGDDLIRLEKIKDFMTKELKTSFETPASMGGPLIATNLPCNY